MKKTIRIIGIIALLAIIGLTMTACFGNSPKSLAKQTNNLYQQMEKAGDDVKKIEDLFKKMETIDQKVEKLSEKDQEIYLAELTRLTSGSSGSSNSNPKILAKQSYDLGQQFEEAYGAGDTKKIDALEKKAEELGKKVDKLSEKDQEIYLNELIKLYNY